MSSELPHQRVREECEEELQLQLKSWWRDNEQGKKLWQMGKKKKEKKNPSNPTLLPRDTAAKTEQCGCTGWCCLATSAKWTLPGSSDKKLEARAHAHTHSWCFTSASHSCRQTNSSNFPLQVQLVEQFTHTNQLFLIMIPASSPTWELHK